MADLDNFFAKKDKKKSKSKPKNLEELVKNLEETTKREAAAKPKKPEGAPVVAAPVDGAAPESVASGDEKAAPEQVQSAEEEWDEFEQEQQKDYTGLKIGQLTLNDEDEQSPLEGDDEDGDSDSGLTSGDLKRSSGGGPWKKVIPAEEVTQIPMEKPSSKLYISPAMRSQGVTPARVKVRNRAAPDITNADYFPTLGAARPEEQRKKKNEPAFEEVKHGGRVQRVQETIATSASVANRFQTLDEDNS